MEGGREGGEGRGYRGGVGGREGAIMYMDFS